MKPTDLILALLLGVLVGSCVDELPKNTPHHIVRMPVNGLYVFQQFAEQNQ